MINLDNTCTFYAGSGEKDGTWVQINLYDNLTPEIECYKVLPETEHLASFSNQENAIEFVQNYFNN